MKISIITTITDPKSRQDKFEEAFRCYSDFADEVIIVNGGKPIYTDGHGPFEKLKFVNLEWPEEWSWVELPRHLNAGLEKCTGDWVIKLDIDQFIHENDFGLIRRFLESCPSDGDVVTFQKMTPLYGGKYYQKGPTPIAFRRKLHIVIGKDMSTATDLCFPISQTGVEVITQVNTETGEAESLYDLPIGDTLKRVRGREHFWNYDYFFKTQEFTKKEFWRFSRAYHRHFNDWRFGSTEEASFEKFMNGMKAKYKRAPYEYKFSDHPKYIREAVENLTPEQFGYNAWGLLM